MGCSTFCGILTIQVGVTVLAAVFLTLGAVVLVANLFEIMANDSSNYKGVKDEAANKDKGPNGVLLIIVAFSIMLFAIGGLSFCSAYNESRGLALVAMLALILFTTFWITLSILTFLGKSSTVGEICYGLRCPESLWLANLNFRKDNGHNVSSRSLIFKDNVNDNFKSESSRLSFEIQNAFDELEKFSLCLKLCCKEECAITKEDKSHGYCSISSLSNIIKRTHTIKGLTESILSKKNVLETNKNELGKGLFNAIKNNATNSLAYQNDDSTTTLPQGEIPVTSKYRKEQLSDTTDVKNEKKYIRKQPEVDLNKTDWSELIKSGNARFRKEKVLSKYTYESKLMKNEYKSLPNEKFYMKEVKEDNKVEEESKYIYGLPFTAALSLFVANLLFFIFTAIILWSWIQELSYLDEFDELVYYY